MKRIGSETVPKVDLYIQNDTLFADANVAVGGIQLDIKGVNSAEEVKILKTLKSFEAAHNLMGDTLRMIFYSISGKTVPAGQRIPLLRLKEGISVSDAVFGETKGNAIPVNYILARVDNISSNMNQNQVELEQNYPNPVISGQTIIPVHIYEPVDEISLVVTNMLGQQVDVIKMTDISMGKHLINWKTSGNKGIHTYTLKIKANGQTLLCPAKMMLVK